MKVRTLKLPPDLDRRLDRFVTGRGVSRSFVVREALAAYLRTKEPEPQSVGALAADLAGCLSGPGDLSTNPKHMEGFGLGRPIVPPSRRPARRRVGNRKR